MLFSRKSRRMVQGDLGDPRVAEALRFADEASEAKLKFDRALDALAAARDYGALEQAMLDFTATRKPRDRSN